MECKKEENEIKSSKTASTKKLELIKTCSDKITNESSAIKSREKKLKELIKL